MGSINWSKQKKVLEAYAKKKGYEVYYKKTKDFISWVDSSKSKIVIHTGNTEEVQFYHLAHELGHVLQQQNGKRYEKMFSHIFDRFHHSSVTYKMKIIEEEIDAWNLGLKLTKRLNLKVNRRSFEICRASRLASYIRWAA